MTSNIEIIVDNMDLQGHIGDKREQHNKEKNEKKEMCFKIEQDVKNL